MSEAVKKLTLDKSKMRHIGDMTTRDVLSAQNHLSQMRFATVKAQTDLSHCLMLEPGETQDALQGEVLAFLRDAHAHFKSLLELLIQR